MKKSVLTLCCILIVMFVAAQSLKYSKVKIAVDAIKIKQIAALGIPLDAGEYQKDNFYVAELSETDLKLLDDNAFSYEVIIDDMTAFYIERNKNPENYNKYRADICGATSGVETPSHFILGSVGGYYNLSELYAQLDSMRLHYPNLITAKQQIGTILSIEGRPVYYVKLSDNADTDENEPEALYVAMNHAREPMGMQQLVFFMWHLLENYGTNEEITQLLENTELYFVPCVNVDGYNYNCTNSPDGGGMWRKNLRDNGDGSQGVDLNRNYGYEWGYDDNGSSPDPSSETYRGTAAFSEPEIQAVKWLCEHRNFVTAIDYHCYGNYLLYPWGYTDGMETPDSLLYHEYARLMTADNAYAYGTAYQTVGYAANGTSLDYYYGEQTAKNKIMLLSPEAGNADDGFWPDISRIIDIAKGDVEPNLYIARFAGKYAHVKDLSPAFTSQQNGYLKFEIKRLGLADPATFTVSLSPLSSNVVSTGSQKVFSSLSILGTAIDSIEYSLSPSVISGEEIQFLLIVNNGLYSISDTISKIYGNTMTVMNDNCNSINGWTADSWGVCSSEYHSATGSIADSPVGTYSDNASNSIMLNSEFDLSNASAAVLTFWAKWEVEAGYDYVQLSASSDGGTSWVPLCGNYTHPGTTYQLLDEPVYDGQQDWVLEEVNLNDFLGQNLLLKFTLVSDNYSSFDGYYFDDINVVKVENSYSGIVNETENFMISEAFPNPASEIINIKYSVEESCQNAKVIFVNSLGQVMAGKFCDQSEGQLNFDLSDWPSGIYMYWMTSDSGCSDMKKFTKVR